MYKIVETVTSIRQPAGASCLRRVSAVAHAGQKQTKADILTDADTGDLTLYLTRVGRTRDRAAFELLFRHFGPRIRAYMLKRACDGPLAEELMQETMMLVWRKAARFDPQRGNASAWIFTIARNVRVDSLRKSKRPTFDPDDPAFVPDEPVAPDSHYEQGQNAERMREALATLPAEQAELLKMSFFEELPHSMIAEKTSLPLGTVKSRIRAAFSRLRHTLGEER